MSVTPSDFLQSAIALSNNIDEMAQRNALSRAYYAAYHLAVQHIKLDATEHGEERKGVHRRFIDQLQEHDGGSTERNVGGRLNQMYQRRIVADYRLDESLRHDSVARQIDVARQVFHLLT